MVEAIARVTRRLNNVPKENIGSSPSQRFFEGIRCPWKVCPWIDVHSKEREMGMLNEGERVLLKRFGQNKKLDPLFDLGATMVEHGGNHRYVVETDSSRRAHVHGSALKRWSLYN